MSEQVLTELYTFVLIRLGKLSWKLSLTDFTKAKPHAMASHAEPCCICSFYLIDDHWSVRQNHLSRRLNFHASGCAWNVSCSLFAHHLCPPCLLFFIHSYTPLRIRNVSPYCTENMRWLLSSDTPLDLRNRITYPCSLITLPAEHPSLPSNTRKQTGAIKVESLFRNHNRTVFSHVSAEHGETNLHNASGKRG